MTEWVSIGLRDHHLLDEFDCGVDILNRWLSESASRADKLDTARTYVWTRRGEHRVFAYFTITPTTVDRPQDGISRTACGGLNKVPGYLLAKLALDRAIAGQGNGRQLVLDAIYRIVGVAQVGGGRLIVVDAIDEGAARFYEKLDFKPVAKTPLRLYMKLATARAALGIDQPINASQLELGASDRD